jgi:hypothetical protein
VTLLVTGALGALVLLVALRLRLRARITPSHLKASDSSAESGVVMSRRQRLWPELPGDSLVESSAGPGIEPRANSGVKVSSPFHGPREIDLSLFRSAIRANKALDERAPSLRLHGYEAAARTVTQSTGRVPPGRKGFLTERRLTYILVDEHGRPIAGAKVQRQRPGQRDV